MRDYESNKYGVRYRMVERYIDDENGDVKYKLLRRMGKVNIPTCVTESTLKDWMHDKNFNIVNGDIDSSGDIALSKFKINDMNQEARNKCVLLVNDAGDLMEFDQDLNYRYIVPEDVGSIYDHIIDEIYVGNKSYLNVKFDYGRFQTFDYYVDHNGVKSLTRVYQPAMGEKLGTKEFYRDELVVELEKEYTGKQLLMEDKRFFAILEAIRDGYTDVPQGNQLYLRLCDLNARMNAYMWLKLDDRTASEFMYTFRWISKHFAYDINMADYARMQYESDFEQDDLGQAFDEFLDFKQCVAACMMLLYGDIRKNRNCLLVMSGFGEEYEVIRRYYDSLRLCPKPQFVTVESTR